MGTRFHINPITGYIGICKVTDSECKYYNDYIKYGYDVRRMHYRTQEEAVRYAQLNIWNQKKPRKEAKMQWSEEIKNPFTAYKDIDNRFLQDRDGVIEFIKKTDDKRLLSEIFDRRVLVTDDLVAPLTALMNPKFPQEIIEHITQKPELYNTEFLIRVAYNDTFVEQFFTEDQLITFYDNIESHTVVEILNSQFDEDKQKLTLEEYLENYQING